MDNRIEVYTDGSSFIKFKEKFYEASSAVLIFLNDKKIYEGGLYHKNGTNSLGEVYAMLMALCKLNDLFIRNPELAKADITIYADSDYVVKSVTNYIKVWARQGLENNWISYSTKHEVAYQSIWKYIYPRFIKGNPYGLHFRHINSHIHKEKSVVPIQKARFNFMKRNEIDITLEEFQKHSARNDEVDQLADKIRKDQTYFYEICDADYLKQYLTLARDGSFVIRKRIIDKN